ncbi:MAG: redoxin domain-containing protein [Flavobacteriales bacterium]
MSYLAWVIYFQRIAILVFTWALFFSGIKESTHSSDNGLRVIYFLSPGCTICQYYTLEMRKIAEDFHQAEISFTGVFSASSCDDEVVKSFREKYEIPFDLVCDSSLHQTLNATVTPEVFVLTESGDVLYSGRIDDSYAAIGKRRPRAKHHELRDALHALMKGDSIKVSRTTPVGCILQK